MARMPGADRSPFLRDCLSAGEAAANGVTAKTNATRQKYWRHWEQYANSANIDPFLNPSVPPLERDIVTGAFAARVRTGKYGNGDQLKVSGVTDALAAISKTIELAGKPSQLYRAENKYQLHLERVVEGFRRMDPPTIPQLAVPVTVPTTAYDDNVTNPDPILRRIGCLVLVAFYFLLRVGEYTKPRFVIRNGKKVPATRTRQFVVGNIGFFKNGVVIPRTSPLNRLLTADLAVMKISNQKNGRMGQTITQHSTETTACPVSALAHIVHNIISNGGNEDTLLCSVWDRKIWVDIEAHHIIKMVRDTTKKLKLHHQAIDHDLVGAHSLRAGGAMALKLHGYDDTTIMKMGRWTSLTFLQYIHNQIAHLSKDISKRMSIPLPFVNVAAI